MDCFLELPFDFSTRILSRWFTKAGIWIEHNSAFSAEVNYLIFLTFNFLSCGTNNVILTIFHIEKESSMLSTIPLMFLFFKETPLSFWWTENLLLVALLICWPIRWQVLDGGSDNRWLFTYLALPRATLQLTWKHSHTQPLGEAFLGSQMLLRCLLLELKSFQTINCK